MKKIIPIFLVFTSNTYADISSLTLRVGSSSADYSLQGDYEPKGLSAGLGFSYGHSEKYESIFMLSQAKADETVSYKNSDFEETSKIDLTRTDVEYYLRDVGSKWIKYYGLRYVNLDADVAESFGDNIQSFNNSYNDASTMFGLVAGIGQNISLSDKWDLSWNTLLMLGYGKTDSTDFINQYDWQVAGGVDLNLGLQYAVSENFTVMTRLRHQQYGKVFGFTTYELNFNYYFN